MNKQTAEARSRMDTSERDLGIIGELISEPDRWSDWISEDETRVALLERAGASVRRMAAQTDWSVDELLEKLGCRSRESHKIQEMSAAQLRRCNDYFHWIETLCRLVDRTAERRRIVIDAAHFFRRADRDLLRSRAAISAGQLSPIEYLKLGEIDKAFQTAESALTGKPIDDAVVHLRARRIDRYLDENDSTISPAMRERIGRHLVTCRRCSEAARLRKANRQRMGD
jgi:hypothetical protein